MKFKRKTALFISILMLSAIILSACKSTDDSGGTSKPDSSVDSTGDVSKDAGSGGDGEMLGNMYLTGLPIVEEQETFTILVDGGNLVDIEEAPMLKLLEEQTNIKVEYLSYPYEVAQERVNILLNSGEYPEVFAGWITPDPVRYGVKEGVFIPLEDLFEEHAPNIMHALSLEGVRSEMTLPDGHIYAPPYVVPEPELVFGPWINQSWLDELGLDMPTTTEELYDVLVAFRDKDANGNGDPNDEIPLASRADHFFKWTGLFGVPGNRHTMDDEMVFGPITENYKEAMKYFARLYAEGLIDPEIFTQDMNNYNGKNKGEDTLYGVAIAYYPRDFSPGLDDNGDSIRADEYVPLPPISNPQGYEPMWNRQGYGLTVFRNQFAITDNAKNPEIIVRWLDNLYSEENSIQASWGVYDVTLQKNDDGTYENLPLTDITGSPNYYEFISPLPKYVRLDDVDKLTKTKDAEFDDMQNKALDDAWANNMVQKDPVVYLSDQDAAEVASIETDINNYVNQMRAAWVSGESNVDDDWDSYLAHLDNLGLQTYLEIYGNAYADAMK